MTGTRPGNWKRAGEAVVAILEGMYFQQHDDAPGNDKQRMQLPDVVYAVDGMNEHRAEALSVSALIGGYCIGNEVVISQ